jgi:FKBP-type peptidyl-prolyl cis-trans isomerase 2
MNRRHFVGKTLLVGSSILATSTASSLPGNAQDPPQKLEFRTDESTGVMVADIRVVGTTTNNANGSGHPAVVVQPDSKVNIHITGRLLGKNGWIFENSQLEGEPYRLQLGQNAVVPGLELGLLGMAQGGKRRIVVPSEQGYLNKQLEPIPREFGNRQRLYTTVMNSVRVDRERTQLGSDLAGKVVFDVEVLRIR